MGEIKVTFDYYVRSKGFFTATLSLPQELKKYNDDSRRQVITDYLCRLHKLPTFNITGWRYQKNPIEIITAKYIT